MTILIVGGTRGIGLGLVRESLDRSEGAVYATARSGSDTSGLDALRSEHGDRLHVLTLDLLDQNSVDAATTELKKHASSLDRLWINAGIIVDKSQADELSADDLLETLQTNVVGVQRVAKAFAPFLKQSKAAKLIFLSTMNSSIAGIDECDRISRSIFGSDRPAGRTPAYSISKAALNMAAQQWARALPDVVVIAILPGCVETDMNPGKGSVMINVETSARGMIKEVEAADRKRAAEGVLTWEGTVWPW